MSGTYNLKAHYTNNSRTQKPNKNVANPPNDLQVMHLYNDKDANRRLKMINDDIYIKSENEKSKSFKNFLKVFSAIVIAVVAFVGLKNIFKKS